MAHYENDLSEPIDLKTTDQEVVEAYTPEDKEVTVVSNTFTKFREAADYRNVAFELFDGSTLIDKIDDGVQQFVTNVYERSQAEDWQAKVNQPFSRNKLIAVLSKVSSIIPGVETVAVGDEDITRARLVNDLKEHADRVDDDDELIFFTMLEAAVKGTAVGYEGYTETERTVRDIVSYDGADGLKLKEGKKKVKKLSGKLVPLEDFYPSSPYIRKIKDMPYCFWRTVMDWEKFTMDFYMYERTALVQKHQLLNSNIENRPFYENFISQDVDDGSVEVVRYYNQERDEFVIIANGVWLNPVKVEGDEYAVSPIPFTHKTLPFWSFIYEPLGNFFYGKSFIDKLMSTQVTLNTLYNMMLDQSFLSIFPPILVEGIDDIEDDYLRPGRRIPVSNPNNYKELAISAPSNFHTFILEFTKRTLEESSLDASSQGVAGAGDRVTATEIERAAAGVEAMLGLFMKFVKWGLRDKARLRAKNVLQFYKKPMIEGVLGEGGTAQFSKAFNTIKIENTTLTSGKRGTKVIEIFADKGDMPTKPMLRMQAEVLSRRTGVKTEKLAVSADYIRDFEFDMRFVLKRDPEMNRAVDKAMTIEKAKLYMEFFPDMVDRTELAFQVAEAFGDRPERMFSKPTIESVLAPSSAKPGATQPGMSQNMVKMAQMNQNPMTAMGNL